MMTSDKLTYFTQKGIAVYRMLSGIKYKIVHP